MSQNYVAHAMWIVIVTFATLIAISYLVYFHRHVRSTSGRVGRHQSLLLVGRRSSARLTLQRVVRRTLRRVRALSVVCSVFVVCCYPRHLLSVVDPSFRQPFKVDIRNARRRTLPRVVMAGPGAHLSSLDDQPCL